jgi:hypothetical protein
LNRRAELHATAERIARRMVEQYGSKLPEDVRTTISFYIASSRGYDRAAEHVITLASALGLPKEG